jgi:hypothetical protein
MYDYMNCDGHRSERIMNCLNDCRENNSIVIFSGRTSDRFVYGEILTNLEHLLAKTAMQAYGMRTWRYTLDEGAVDFTPENSGLPGSAPPDVRDAQAIYLAFREVFESMNGSKVPILLMVDYEEDLHGDVIWEEQICDKALNPAFHKNGHIVVLVNRKGNAADVFSQIPGIASVRIPLPAYDERLKAIKLMTGSPAHALCLADDLLPETAANISGALSLDDLHRLRMNTYPENLLTFDRLLESKKASILQHTGDLIEIFEVVDLKTGVAGLTGPILYLQDQLELGINTFGVLLVGSPGTGKTLVSKAMAYEMGIPCVAFKSIKSSLYGEAERNMRNALDMVEALAPCLVLFDEIERYFHKRGGNSDNSSATHSDADIEGMLLGFVNDVIRKKDGIVIVGTVNNATEWLDTAALDRFEVVPVLPETNPVNKAKIAAIEAKTYDVTLDIEGGARAFNESEDDYSGRDIGRMVKPARRHANGCGHPETLGYEDMKYAIESANCAIDQQDIYQCYLALYQTSDQRYYSWNAAKILGYEEMQVPEWFRGFVDESGYMDKASRQRLGKKIDSMGVEYGQ